MSSIHICGGRPLDGEVKIQGSKNATLPIMAACVLTRGVNVLENCPRIADVYSMCSLLETIGCGIQWEGHRLSIDASHITGSRLPEKYVTAMRSSVMLMGALLGRKKEVCLNFPGGCVIGSRPIDIHIKALEQLNAVFEEDGTYLRAKTSKLVGSSIALPFQSVGATENVILAAVCAQGETLIENGAREPEIQALCLFLQKAGADLELEDEGSRIRIRGKEYLNPCEYTIPPDRIVAGTYLLGCMAAGGRICLRGADVGGLSAVLEVIGQMGGEYREEKEGISLMAPCRPDGIPYLQTQVYPGFPTDLQSPLMAVLSLAKGDSLIEETIFENRFRIVPQLKKMGARIRVKGNRAYIKGVRELWGKKVQAEELRGGAALCVAGLGAKGDTYVENRYFIDRGYESIERDLRFLGGRL